LEWIACIVALMSLIASIIATGSGNWFKALIAV
jgi:hypothetical protein